MSTADEPRADALTPEQAAAFEQWFANPDNGLESSDNQYDDVRTAWQAAIAHQAAETATREREADYQEPRPLHGPTPIMVRVPHPLIEGLCQTLPPAGALWPAEKRQLWLEAAERIFDMIYVTETDATKRAR